MANLVIIPHLKELNLELGCNALGNKGIDELGKRI